MTEGDLDLISIIVPVYKVEDYLDKCVKSIVNQTYTELEIILIDDGSPDECPRMCDEWSKRDGRIKVIHKQNGGLSDARNVGLGIAKGEFLAFIDSDDLVDVYYIEYLHDAIRKSNADIAICGVYEFEDGNNPKPFMPDTPKKHLYTPLEALDDLITGGNCRAVVWNKLYKREILKDENFEVGKIHEDEFFTYRIYDKAQRLIYIDYPMYFYRQRINSIMSTFSISHLDLLDAYLGRINFLEQKYPTLVNKDKLTFCMCCINFYASTLGSSLHNKKEALKRIKEKRQKISLKNCRGYAMKEKVYIIGSSAPFIGLISRVKIIRGNI